MNPAAFRDPALARAIIDRIARRRTGEVTIMEFCGGHTVAMLRAGIRDVLPAHVHMRSGPGCPVCVTSAADLDRAAALAACDRVTLTTYGDMLRVPGSHGSLADARARGCDVRTVYSTLDALAIARAHPDRAVVFFAVGFETTAPAAAAAVLAAEHEQLDNFFVASVMKDTIAGARALLSTGDVRVDAVIGPGHVSTVIGAEAWRFLPDEYGIPVAISGFEPVDLLSSIDALLVMRERGTPGLVNTYARVVRTDGNPRARAAVARVFEPCDADWRGFGTLSASGLRLRERYAAFDADRIFPTPPGDAREHPACRCGDVLRGVIEPDDCRVFGTACTPETPLGPCMVSSEGSCAAHYTFRTRVARAAASPRSGGDPPAAGS